MTTELLRIGITTNVNITDDLGNVLVDKSNSIHPQNMSRVIARALSNEPNSTIYKLALGRGGTFTDATGEISFRRPNDGVAPDASGYQSRLYDEVYYEIIDDGSSANDTGPGSYPSGTKLNKVVSQELDTGESQIIVTCILDNQEPNGQELSSLIPASLNGTFVFDELGLFTSGKPLTATQGYHDVLLKSAVTSTSLTHLDPLTPYNFRVTVDGGPLVKTVTFTTPLAGTGASGAITYGDLVGYLNAHFNANNVGIQAQVSQPGGAVTYGNLRLISNTAGGGSSVVITDEPNGYPTGWLFSSLRQTAGGSTMFNGLGTSASGSSEGAKNSPTNTNLELSRMLTHLIFSPVQKDASRVWKITYKLTVVILQSDAVS